MKKYTWEGLGNASITITREDGSEFAILAIGDDTKISLRERPVNEWWMYTIHEESILFHQDNRTKLYISHDDNLCPVITRTDRMDHRIAVYARPLDQNFTLSSVDLINTEAAEAVFLCDVETHHNGKLVVTRLGSFITVIAMFHIKTPRIATIASGYVEVWTALRNLV